MMIIPNPYAAHARNQRLKEGKNAKSICSKSIILIHIYIKWKFDSPLEMLMILPKSLFHYVSIRVLLEQPFNVMLAISMESTFSLFGRGWLLKYVIVGIQW